jgi:undecaprenyl-diphosphatase
LDQTIFGWINRWPESFAPVFIFFSEATKSNVVRALLVLLIIAMIALGPKSRKAAILALVAWPLANGLTDVLKATFQVIRPSVDFPGVIERTGHLTSFGTASAHSANMAAVAFVFTYYLGWWGVPWILIALLTGLSRIYVGVHYPSQVLLGWLCGAFCALLVVKTWEAYVKTRKGPYNETANAATDT